MRRLPRRVLVFLTLAALLVGLGSPSPAQTCAPGTRGALLFDGLNDYVNIPTNAALDGLTNFTFEAWFRATSTGPGFRTLFDKGGGSPYLIGAFPQVGAFLNGNLAIQGGGSVLQNFWRHFALTASGNILTIYLDGQPVGASSYTGPLGSSGADLHLGAASAGGPFLDHWSGALDDIRIWNVARTQQQIDANRLYVLTGSEAGLVAYWRFDAAGQTVVNSATATGAALNGTLGPDATTTSQDPTFTTADFAPMFYCVAGAGQPNSALARLQVNGLGVGPTQGPFSAQVMAGTSLNLSWFGPPNQPFSLVYGPLNTHNINFPCVGIIDIGTPPVYADVNFFMSGLFYPGSLIYVLTSAGTAQQTFTVPQAAVGASVTIQGLVQQPVGNGCPFIMTAAFQITIV
jgi:Concanavalin A-like lectin/glucanases superfamily